MNLSRNEMRKRTRKHSGNTLAIALALVFAGTTIWAQTIPSATKGDPESVRTFYLTNVNEPEEATEVVTALRNLLDPQDKIYFVPSPQNAIMVAASPDQLALAQKLLKDLDRPKKTYRLTYTIAETDDGKPVGSQHFAITVVSRGRTTFKNGSKIPILTGFTNSGSTTSKTELTYIDVGLNIDASLDESANGVRLRTKVERSSVAEEKVGARADDPVIRQTVLEGTSILIPGKQAVLGSLDVPGSTRHLEVQVILDVVP
jgi:type II secretory pathway component GspD/PulD (secretin)